MVLSGALCSHHCWSLSASLWWMQTDLSVALSVIHCGPYCLSVSATEARVVHSGTEKFNGRHLAGMQR